MTTIKGRSGFLGNKETTVNVGRDIKGRKCFGSKLKGQLAKRQIQPIPRYHFPTVGVINIKKFDNKILLGRQ